MAIVNRVLIQSRVLNMTVAEDTGNLYAILDVPEEASLVVHDFYPQDDDHGQVVVSVAEIVGQFDDSEYEDDETEANPTDAEDEPNG